MEILGGEQNQSTRYEIPKESMRKFKKERENFAADANGSMLACLVSHL